MKNKTLIVMAAGMGSRFGGLKQITPMGPNGEFIIDYSIFDAINAGFNKVVFIIKKENYEAFKETIGARVEPHIKAEYVFQDLNNIPSFVKIPKERVKPWGTAHAIYCAKDKVKEPFLVINADDFYGTEAYKVASEFLDKSNEDEYATVGYQVKNTMTENGSVKRGIIETKNNELARLIESKIEKINGVIKASPLSGEAPFTIAENTLVSMNMLVLHPSIFPYIESKMVDFFKTNENNLNDCEFLIPDILTMAHKEGYAKVKVLNTNANWYGVTYKEDTQNVQTNLKRLVEEKKYPNNLWK